MRNKMPCTRAKTRGSLDDHIIISPQHDKTSVACRYEYPTTRIVIFCNQIVNQIVIKTLLSLQLYILPSFIKCIKRHINNYI